MRGRSFDIFGRQWAEKLLLDDLGGGDLKCSFLIIFAPKLDKGSCTLVNHFIYHNYKTGLVEKPKNLSYYYCFA